MSSTPQTLSSVKFQLSEDDRPVIMESDSDSEENINIWPQHITLSNIKRALEGRLPDEGDACAEVTFLAYGASHVVVTVNTLRQKTYVVRITAAVFEGFQRKHPFWQSFKESSEVASMIAIRRMTNIPVPRVYFLDEDKGNTVGGAWTLQGYMEGKTLAELLPELSPAARVQAIQQMADWFLQVFHLDFGTQIGSLHFSGDLKDSQNLSDSNLEIHVGPMVSITGLRHPRLVGPPMASGPWVDARAWLKDVAQGGMDYQRQDPSKADPAYVERIQAIIDEPAESSGLFESLCKTAPRATDMWSPQNIKAVINDDGSVTLVALLDMEGMQVVPRWVLAQTPWIQNLDEDLCKMLLEHLLQDPEFRRAHEEGITARRLLILAQTARMRDHGDKRIQQFREGIWEDEGTLAG